MLWAEGGFSACLAAHGPADDDRNGDRWRLRAVGRISHPSLQPDGMLPVAPLLPQV
jgi:hypothetical protein